LRHSSASTGITPTPKEAFVAIHFRYLTLLSAAGLFSLVLAHPAQAQTIRACANPAGQLRLIGAADSCRPQETLVTWNGAGAGPVGPAGPAGPVGPEGPVGPMGPQGAPGSDAEGVTGGSDHSPFTGNTSPAFLFAAPVPLTTENIATGFTSYMVWANASLQFNSGNAFQGPSPTSAGCSLTYTVAGRPGTYVADFRNVIFPTAALGKNDQIVQLSLGLNGVVGKDLDPPLAASDVVDITLTCSSPYSAPPTGPVPSPVRVTNWSLTGIGISKTFP
jgi:hypothetical protein